MGDAARDTIPLEVVDPKTNIRYVRGRFLGKGGFAKCYEFTNTSTGTIFAGKVISKTILSKPHHKSKTFQEISIHQSITHKYIVKFYTYFEDSDNLYIILELCRKRSLMEMHKRRKALTLPEVRYFMKQILLACDHLHSNKIIHRDLKLGNLFLDDNMDVKVGDFGLATRVSFEGERKKTLCGTPNYIAPEILNKKGHSYEVDIWSLGCIMYTLLVGSPPFETSSLRSTYSKIKKNEYSLPRDLDHDAQTLIRKMLHPQPLLRPNPAKILGHSFFVNQPIPSKLPISCLTTQPRLAANMTGVSPHVNVNTRKPLVDHNKVQAITEKIKDNVQGQKLKPSENMFPQEEVQITQNARPPSDYYIGELLTQLTSVIDSNPRQRFTGQEEDAQDPASVPFIWISKWVDYSDKYGLGYQLCDNSKAVLYNDKTRLVLLPDESTLHYIDQNSEMSYHSTQDYPPHLEKKVKLLMYFITYMAENLLKAGESAPPRENEVMSQVPYLRQWFRTKAGMIFHLTNGTLQINMFKDHTKVIICPIMGAVSYIDEKKNFTTYKFKLIEKYGCPAVLAERLLYAKSVVEKYLIK